MKLKIKRLKNTIILPPLLSKTAAMGSYRALSTDLVFVFNQFNQNKLVIKDQELINDIKNCMGAIKKIEASIRTAHFSQKHRTFPQGAMDVLRRILRRIPLYISVDFEQYADYRKKGKNIKEEWIERAEKAKRLSNHKMLSGLRFFPNVKDWGPPEVITDTTIRYRLTLGLFDYLQRLMIKKSWRPKCCEACGDWFFAVKTNALTCSDYCRDRKFATSPRGKERRRINTRTYRRKLKDVNTEVK